jgi:hypothetical protein
MVFVETFKDISLVEGVDFLSNYIFSKYDNPKILEFEEHSKMKFALDYYLYEKKIISKKLIENFILSEYKIGNISVTRVENKDKTFLIIDESLENIFIENINNYEKVFK